MKTTLQEPLRPSPEPVDRQAGSIHDQLSFFTFRDGNRWAMIAFNLSLDEETSFWLKLPAEPEGTVRQSRLGYRALSDTNEDMEKVTIVETTVEGFGSGYVAVLAPASMTLWQWETLPQ